MKMKKWKCWEKEEEEEEKLYHDRKACRKKNDDDVYGDFIYEFIWTKCLRQCVAVSARVRTKQKKIKRTYWVRVNKYKTALIEQIKLIRIF